MSISGDIIHMSDKDNKFLDDITTGYETWCFLYDSQKNGNLLNGKYHNQYHHHPEAKYLEYMLVKVIL